MTKVFFQIGTNNGNDLFREMVIRENPDIVILVEPNASLISEIHKNYNGIANAFIYNHAVYYRDDEMIELYIPAKNGIMGTRAENNYIFSDLHFSLVPMNDWGNKNDMVKMPARSITFDTICKNHGITTIDYLQIDTEGFDSEIIKMIDLSKYTIDTIRFEKWIFETECFTRYNSERADTLGINGMNHALLKLTEHKYTLYHIADSDGNDIIAKRAA